MQVRPLQFFFCWSQFSYVQKGTEYQLNEPVAAIVLRLNL